MIIAQVLGVVVAGWLTAVLLCHAFAHRSSTPIKLNAELQGLVDRAGIGRVWIRRRGLSGPHQRILAMAAYCFYRKTIFLDERMLLLCDIDQLRWVLGHELGHHALGHCKRSLARVLTGAVFSIPLRGERYLAELERDEDAADLYAETLTGLSRHVLNYGPLSSFFRGL